jgi:insertion element IS1 protein InsB
MKLLEEAVRRMKEHLGGTVDPGRQWGYIRHKLIDLLIIGLCSIITCGERFDKMAHCLIIILKNLDTLLELLSPLKIGRVCTDGNYAYYERFPLEALVVTKKNAQKIERKHLSLRTWSARLARKGIRFSKTEQMHKIVVALIINVWFLGRVCLIQ